MYVSLVIVIGIALSNNVRRFSKASVYYGHVGTVGLFRLKWEAKLIT